MSTKFMKRALELAQKGSGKTKTNPLVGCVIVKNDKIIGEGFHEEFGEAHAEINALKSCKEPPEGSTIFVTLEPCCHFGKTPPCTEALIKAKPAKIIVGTLDPNPLVYGKGVKELRKNGIEVEIGLLERECLKINLPFFTFIRKKRPFVVVKIAQTLDGKIATKSGHSKWITSEESRILVHKMRAEYDAILVGIGTVLEDDPALTVRLVKGRNPKRIVLDTNLRIRLDSHILSDTSTNQTIIFTHAPNPERLKQIQSFGATVIEVGINSSGQLNLSEILDECAKLGICSILVEGGAKVFQSFLASKLFDKIMIFIAPKLVGDDGVSAVGNLGIEKITDTWDFKEKAFKNIGTDILFEGLIEN
ncbi:bifunctional diaminohydroxyphosphoribosylaminopyrimidine deaminase/5-amino-6-(5-phosphoribosylamino)uracil reductase RibD [bacterium]|nr:bifunctional diaminohydroxyphosphoribosylaminopyrimidine deaminase/5-amino-6-(5-phosphoribosylamino)uracil reductase RibD [bacterium]